MRKTLLAALFMAFLFGQLHSQNYQIGVKVGPTLSWARVGSDASVTNIESNGTSARMIFGAFVDIGFKENYFFHTGISYASKKTNLKFMNPNGVPSEISESYSHEYLQIPLLLKLYTNELLLDTKVFFNFGVIPEIRLSTSNDEVTIIAVSKFQNFDLAGNLGAGLEHGLGPNTRVFVGLNYNLGFLNMINQQNTNLSEFNLKSSLFALELGVKF